MLGSINQLANSNLFNLKLKKEHDVFFSKGDFSLYEKKSFRINLYTFSKIELFPQILFVRTKHTNLLNLYEKLTQICKYLPLNHQNVAKMVCTLICKMYHIDCAHGNINSYIALRSAMLNISYWLCRQTQKNLMLIQRGKIKQTTKIHLYF